MIEAAETPPEEAAAHLEKPALSKGAPRTPGELLNPNIALPQIPSTRKATEFIASWNIDEPDLAKE